MKRQNCEILHVTDCRESKALSSVSKSEPKSLPCPSVPREPKLNAVLKIQGSHCSQIRTNPPITKGSSFPSWSWGQLLQPFLRHALSPTSFLQVDREQTKAHENPSVQSFTRNRLASPHERPPITSHDTQDSSGCILVLVHRATPEHLLLHFQNPNEARPQLSTRLTSSIT